MISFIKKNMGSLSVQWWIQGEIKYKNWSQLLYDAIKPLKYVLLENWKGFFF